MEAHKTEIQNRLDTQEIVREMYDKVQRDIFATLRMQFFRDYSKTPEYLIINQR